MAVANYVDAHGCFPPPYVNGPDGKPWHSWRVLILPFLEEKETYAAYNFSEPWDGPNNRKLAERIPRQYVFHGFERPGNTTTNYLAVVGDETIWSQSRKLGMKDVTDGASNTISVIENDGVGVHWMEPRDLELNRLDMKVGSPSGVSSPYNEPAVLMVDGHLRRLAPSLQPKALRAMFTIAGGEPVGRGDDGSPLLEDGRRRPLNEPH